MYLKELFIKDVGPISHFDVQLPFTQDGLPKPLILVGTNGTGKTVLQATIADAIILMATEHFSDTVPETEGGKAFFKLCGAVNQRVDAPYSLSLLSFEEDKKVASYIDLAGKLPPAEISAALKTRFPNIEWPEEGPVKRCAGFDGKLIEKAYRRSALCFFPSIRRELPHWLNVDMLAEYSDEEPKLTDSTNFSNKLGKPVYIDRCRERNKQWILDVMFDSRMEIVGTATGLNVAPYENAIDRLKLTDAKNNINLLLQAVLGDSDLRIHAYYRRRGARLAVAKGAKIIVPSLDHLSLGQSLLFNMFCTIVRYADTYDLTKGYTLSAIEGIVIVDEIDVHLHTDLQVEALPKLIKLFPKIQFIVSTHAPLFMLGMERQFGENGIAILEMPTGERISTERFSEFQRSIDFYKQTKAFEALMRERLLSASKPLVLFEGETDRDYVNSCLAVLGRTDISSAIEVDWVGNSVQGIAQSGGSGSLDIVAKTFRTNPSLLQKKLLLVHDSDTRKQPETIDGTLFIRSLPLNVGNTKFTRGIENLLSEEWARPEYYDCRTETRYGGTIQTLNKRRLCDQVVLSKDPATFAHFGPIIDILEEFLGIKKNP